MTETRRNMSVRPIGWTLDTPARILSDMNDPSASGDPLGEALNFLRMSSVLYSRSELSEPWGVALPPLGDTLMFHVVISGRGWLDVEGAEPCLLQPGDLALVPHGQGHRLLSEPGAEADEPL